MTSRIKSATTLT